jgi:hypothetical protein
MIHHIYTTYSIPSADVIHATENLQEWSLKTAKQYEGMGYKGMVIKKVLEVKDI